jgi:ATP-binding cassette, subfamily B, bacterial
MDNLKHKAMWRENPPMSKSPLRFFLFSSAPHWKAALIAFVLAVSANIIVALTPYIFKLVVEGANLVAQGGAYDALIMAAALYMAVLFFSKLIWRASGFLAARWATGASATGRFALSAYVTLHSRAYFSDRFAGSIMNKVRHAASGMRDIADIFLWDFLELGITAVVSIVIVWLTSPLVAAIFIAWICLILALNAYLGLKRVPLAVRAHALETQVNGATVDLLTNVSAMQEYARREFEIERLRSVIADRRHAHRKSWQFGELTRLYNGLLLALFGGAMVFLTIYLAQAGLLSLGDIVLVLTVIFRIEGQLQSLGSNFNRFAEIWGEIRESLEEIIEPHEIPDEPGARALTVERGAIDFEDVTFMYGESGVFNGLNLHIGPGERVGLVGRSGAGKSTLVRLILRHHDLDGGRIRIDGADITTVTQESLRGAISVVPQEPLLFHRTIRENIQYGNPGASIEEVQRAASLAQAHEFISRLPQGYESMVGERGVKLSGGERQRIVIARAILKNAPILLLDEATSALDSESEVAIQTALKELMKGKTVIAIAHRLSTLREMDRIVVMDKGAVVEQGTHDVLVKRGGIYAELWSHQAGGFLQD